MFHKSCQFFIVKSKTRLTGHSVQWGFLFEQELNCERFSEAMPRLVLVRVVQLLPCQLQPSLPHEPGVEPEVEGALLVVTRHVAGVGLEQHLGVPGQHRAVDRLHCEHI